MTVKGYKTETILEDFGDELKYFFAVRACITDDNCDSNVKIITLEMEDQGAPARAKITGIEIIENGYFLTAPWSYEHGAVKQRRVYRKTGALSSKIEDFSDYGKDGLLFESPDGKTPAQKLFIGQLDPTLTYHFVVRDFDRKGQVADDFTSFTHAASATQAQDEPEADPANDTTTTTTITPQIEPASDPVSETITEPAPVPTPEPATAPWPLDLFTGVTLVEPSAEAGKLDIHWENPPDLTDFFGYRIYDLVDNVLTSLANCVCVDNNCIENPITSCAITGTPGKGYQILVRPFDTTDKESTVLTQPYTTVVIPDTAPPSFPESGSAISATYEATYNRNNIAFKLASDDHFNFNPQMIEYKIYGISFPGTCAGRSFADIALNDSNLIASHIADPSETIQTTYKDRRRLNSKTSYLYRITATDQADLDQSQADKRNTLIDSSFACVETPEIYYPQFVGGDSCPEIISAGGCPSIQNESGVIAPRWAISWDMIDPAPNGIDKANIDVKIMYALSDSPTPPKADFLADGSLEHYTTEVISGAGLIRQPSAADTYMLGPKDLNTWVHYAVVLSKSVDGTVTHRTVATASVHSQNKIEITAVTRDHGTYAGGKLLMIKGSGFTSQTEIYFKDQEEVKKCIGTKLVETTNRQDPRMLDQVIMCTTPLWTLPNGQSEEKIPLLVVREAAMGDTEVYSSGASIGYTFYDPEQTNNFNNACDIPANLTAYFAGGYGSSWGDPLIVCNKQQFINATGPFIFALGDHIDLRSSVPWKTLYLTAGVRFDGKNFALFGLTLDAENSRDLVNHSSELHVGIYDRLNHGCEFRNFSILGAKLLDDDTAPEGTTIGFLGGLALSVVMNNMTIQGTIGDSGSPIVNKSRFIGGFLGNAPYVRLGLDNSGMTSININSEQNFQNTSFGGVSGTEGFITSNANIRIKAPRSFKHMGGVIGELNNNASLTVENINVYFDIGNDGLNSNTIDKNFGGIIGVSKDYTENTNNQSVRNINNINIYGKIDAGVGSSATSTTGGIAGTLQGSRTFMNNVNVAASIRGNSNLGGFVGEVVHSLNSCSLANCPDGIELQIDNSRFNGQIYLDNSEQHSESIGGFIVRSIAPANQEATEVQITNSIFNGKIIAVPAPNVYNWFARIGGLIGQLGTTGGLLPTKIMVDTVAVLGIVKASGSSIGGVIGSIDPTVDDLDQISILIKNSYISPDMFLARYSTMVGGAIGIHRGTSLTIENSLFETKLLYPVNWIGGLVGNIQNVIPDDPSITLTKVISRTMLNVLADNPSNIYGLIGKDNDPGTIYNISDSYFDLGQTNPIQPPVGIERITSDESYGKTASFIDNSDNFNTWSIYDPDTNPDGLWTWKNGKPELRGIIQLLSSFPGN